MKDRIADLSIKLENLGKSPAFTLSGKYITEEEACRILKCFSKVLAGMGEKHEIPYYQIKRRIIYRASDLAEYIERHAVM